MHPATPDDKPAAPSPALRNLADALGIQTIRDFDLGVGTYGLAVPVLDTFRSAAYQTAPGDLAFARGLDALREAIAAADALAAGLDDKGRYYLRFAADETRTYHSFREWALDGQPRELWQEVALAQAFVRFLAKPIREAARTRDIYTAGVAILDGNRAAFPSVRKVDAAVDGQTEPLTDYPTAHYLSVYYHEIVDGGPEEGGWTWHKKTLRATFALPEPTEDFDPAACPPYIVEAARATALALGLVLPGETYPTPDGGTRPARPASSCSPEVDGLLIVEPFPGSETCTAPEPWE